MHIDYLLSIRLKVNNREEKITMCASKLQTVSVIRHALILNPIKKKKKRAANYNTPLTIGYK